MIGRRYDFELDVGCFKFRLVGTVEVLSGPPKPGPLILTVLKEVDGMRYFKLTLPMKSAPDVVTQEVTVTIADGNPIVVSANADDDEILDDRFVGENDVNVHTNLVNVDLAGNRGPDHFQQFTLSDTLPPPEAGDIGLVVTRED